MENSMAILAETFGVETVTSAVVVCIVMMLIKKFKPNLSPKAELGIRLLISLITHLLFILISQGDFIGCLQGATSVCGVSMIVCTLISKSGSAQKTKDNISEMLPQLSEEKLTDILGEDKGFKDVPIEIVNQNSSGGDRPSDGV